MNSIYMNHYVNIMHSFEEKGKDDIPTDEELLLFSETENEVKEVKKPKKPAPSGLRPSAVPKKISKSDI